MSHALVTITKIHMVRLAQDSAANGNMVAESSFLSIIAFMLNTACCSDIQSPHDHLAARLAETGANGH